MINKAYCNSLVIFLSCFVATQAKASCTPNSPVVTNNLVLVDNANGTVTDTSTGLMWRQCASSINIVDGACENTNQLGTFQQVVQAIEVLNSDKGYAGYNDWRLPSVKEFDSIIEENCYPAINRTRLPTYDMGWHWTSTPSGPSKIVFENSCSIWTVELSTGETSIFSCDETFSYRVVRGTQ